MKLAMILVLTNGALLGAFGTVLLKVGASGRTSLLEFINPYIIGGLAMHALGSAFWIFGMSKQSLTTVYPFTVLSFLLVYLVGTMGLGEAPSTLSLAGVGFILFGLFLVTSGAT